MCVGGGGVGGGVGVGGFNSSLRGKIFLSPIFRVFPKIFHSLAENECCCSYTITILKADLTKYLLYLYSTSVSIRTHGVGNVCLGSPYSYIIRLESEGWGSDLPHGETTFVEKSTVSQGHPFSRK